MLRTRERCVLLKRMQKNARMLRSFEKNACPTSTHNLTVVSGHFPKKINDDFCLAFYINPSSMEQCLHNSHSVCAISGFRKQCRFMTLTVDYTIFAIKHLY